MKIVYSEKFEKMKGKTYFPLLSAEEQEVVRRLALQHKLTYQELRQLAEAGRDLTMWQEGGLSGWRNSLNGGAENLKSGKLLLTHLNAYLNSKRREPKSYPEEGFAKPAHREKKQLVQIESDKKIQGMCPVASPQTVCCNLRTIDAVENCAFGCSYCTIQTFYTDKFLFDNNFVEKLNKIEIEADRPYHFGTGQSSDSLVWGNKYGNLDALCNWAAEHPNVVLELKTKSDNIAYFLQNEIPPNLVCSWSLNTPVIIRNEEHFTANLEQRLHAARAIADRGVKVSFHFHPMVYYKNWEVDYPEIAARLIEMFDAQETLFISFGSVTMIKPAMKKIRNNGHQTKILQMQLVADPHGKQTYPDETKVMMFKRMYEAFQPWRDDVFFYLCMEKPEIWLSAFGSVYENNDLFESELLSSCMSKINQRRAKTCSPI